MALRAMAPGRRRAGLALVGLGALLLGGVGSLSAYTSYSSGRLGDVETGLPADTAPYHQSLAEAYPLEVAPQFWMGPLWAEAERDDGTASGYLPPSDAALPPGGLAHPTRLRVPAIGLDTAVMDLAILDLGDARQYQTPPFVAGHIPESSNPGEVGNVWLFGHLESPIRGEGSVFGDLPLVYDLLRQGRSVYIVVESGDGSFLYRATRFRKIPQGELYLWGSDARSITLVTCWPRFKYDERILVEGELVGVKLAGQGAAGAPR